MTRSAAPIASFALLFAVAACTPPVTEDGGAPDDAGPSEHDAGPGVDDAGPGPDDAGPGPDDAGPGEAPASYSFESRFGDGSSVSYGGQVQRQLQLVDLTGFIGGLTDTSYQGAAAEDVLEDLAFFFDYKNEGSGGGDAIRATLKNDDQWLQETYGDVGSPTSLFEKMPDQDATDWTGTVVGVGAGDLTPTEVVEAWFDELADLVIARANGTIPTDPDDNDIAKPFVTDDGRDLAQLIQKYLGGAVSFSQAAGDYMSDATPGKGILSDNEVQDGDALHTSLEHQWDEGFGYFGASRDYGDYTDDEIAAKGGRAEYSSGYHDSDGDGLIDAKSEFVFGHAQNAAKRDRGSAEGAAATDFTEDAFRNFIAGRHLITTVGGALSEEELDELRGYRDAAITAWEKAIAASAVHYINDVLQDMSKFGVACDGGNEAECYKYLDHAKHWSELKGFALSLQFNPRSPLSATDLAEVHSLLGETPALPSDEQTVIDDYKVALRDARALIGSAYDFHADNLGNDDGSTGW